MNEVVKILQKGRMGMAFLKSLDISASALSAQRLRMDVIAQNVANANTTRTPDGGPYRRRIAVLEAEEGGFSSVLSNSLRTQGVRVSAIVPDTATDFKIMHDPTHPDADENGDVRLPNVDILREMTDMMAATRAYEANLTVLNSLKSMAQKALEFGR